MLWQPRPWTQQQFLSFQRAEIELYICEKEKKYLKSTREQLTKYSVLPIKAGTYPSFDPTVAHPEAVMYGSNSSDQPEVVIKTEEPDVITIDQ